MGKWHLEHLACAALAMALAVLPGCGGSKPAGASPIPGKITLSPATSASLQLGATLTFTATAQNGAGTSVTPAFTYQSSNTSILNIAPTGAACAGRWDATFTTCTPGASGSVQVTASALGTTSAPTVVFVHPPIDNITVTEVLNTTPPPPSGPCFSQGRNITLQATAWSQNSDVTATVGPFTWTANNASVVTVTPIINSTFNLATNQATATAATPGLTQIYACASGVSSRAFQQTTPEPTEPGLVWDFFETCPVQNITLQLTPNGLQSGITTFNTNKGTAEPVTATVTDVLGNSSLPNNTGAPVLTNVPLTWSASKPGAVAATSCTGLTCSVGTPGPGAGSITASCTPPTCNIGFPQIPAGLSSPACATALKLQSCQAFIPVPVYATTAISGEVAGTPTATSVIATTRDCATNNLCATDLYNISTSANVPGNPTAVPVPPNSLMIDLTGDKAYMGSQFGAQLITIANIGSTSTGAFTALAAATGNILAISPDGNLAIFSDTAHSPNQVYVTNATNATSPSISPFNITKATAAGFSPDGLKAFIVANGGNSIYVYSTEQALQNLSNPPTSLPSGTGSANLITFSPNGAFAYIAGSPSSGPVVGPALTAVNVCNSQIATHTVPDPPNPPIITPQVMPLGTAPLFLTQLPNTHLGGNGLVTFSPTPLQVGQLLPFPDGVHFITLDKTGLNVITAISTAITISPANPPPEGSCPQDVTHTVQRLELGQGTFNPVAFFVSPDGSQLYILASDRSSILVYNFNTGAVSGIETAGNATPVVPLNPLQTVAGMSTDGTLIYIAGSDGLLHQISTTSAIDLAQIPFPNLANLSNAFCSLNSSSAQSCKLDLVAVKP